MQKQIHLHRIDSAALEALARDEKRPVLEAALSAAGVDLRVPRPLGRAAFFEQGLRASGWDGLSTDDDLADRRSELIDLRHRRAAGDSRPLALNDRRPQPM